MDTPIQDAPHVEAIYSLEDIVKQVEASGINLGDNPHKRIQTFVEYGLLPPPQNGRYPSWVVQRVIAIQNKLYEGKSLQDLKDEVGKERRRFLNSVTDLNSMVHLYKKFSNNSMFFLASLLLLGIVSFGFLAAGLTGTKNPVVVASENVIKAAANAGKEVAKQAAKPVGNTIVTIIKTNKDENSTSADPLQLTNLETETPVIPENLAQFDENGNLNVEGDLDVGGFITAEGFVGALDWDNLENRPNVLSAIDGVQNDEGNIDLVAGSGISINPDNEANSITISSLVSSPTPEFIFKNIAVSGQSTIVSDQNNDTLTFAAGSNITLATNASTDTLTISASGGSSDADTLDGLDSTAFAVLSQNETISGNWTFSSNSASAIIIKPSSLPPADEILFDLQNIAGTSMFNIDEDGDVTAAKINGTIIDASSSIRTGGAVRIDAFGTLWGIVDINSSGNAVIGGDITIGDGLSGGDWLTVTKSGVANAISTTRDSDRIVLEGSYWDGAAEQTVEMHIMNNVLDASGTQSVSFLRGPGVEVARFESDGDALIYRNLQLGSGGIFTVGGGLIQTALSQLTLQATGANADVIIQGGLCVNDATGCPDVPAGALRVDTAGGSADDPGDVFDLAEIYNSIESVSPGEIVAAAGNRNVKKSSGEYDDNILGITSSHPAALIDEGTFSVGVDKTKYNPKKPWVALAGRVPTKVSTENGNIAPGDPLTSSSTPGVAMKATKSGPIVGKSLESYSGAGVGKVMVFVSTGWYVAPLTEQENLLADLIGLTHLNVEHLIASKVTADVIETDELVVSGETSGQTEIAAGNSNVEIETDRVKDSSKVLVTFESDYSPASRYWVEKDPGSGFTVKLDASVSVDAGFSWLVVN